MENNRMLLLWSHYTKSLRILCNSYSSGRKWIEFLCSVLVSCTDFCLLASAMLWFKRKLEASETYWLPQTFEILILLKSSPSVNTVKENEEKCVFRLENGSKMVDRSSKTRGNAPPPPTWDHYYQISSKCARFSAIQKKGRKDKEKKKKNKNVKQKTLILMNFHSCPRKTNVCFVF